MSMTETEVLHPVPTKTSKWGYDHLPWVYKVPDPHFVDVTSTGSLEAGLVRLVAGYSARNNSFSRGPDSWMSLDTYSVGFAHLWAETAPDMLAKVASRHPRLAEYAWGQYGAGVMKDADTMRRITGTRKGEVPHRSDLDWLLAGWHEIARHPDVLRVHVEHWLLKYVDEALVYLRYRGWQRRTTLAGLVRVNNSGGMRRLFDRAVKETNGAGEDEVLRLVFTDEDLYGKPDRLRSILDAPEFSGDVSEDWSPSVSSLRYDVAVVRPDGSTPRFPSLQTMSNVEPPQTPIQFSRPSLRRGDSGPDVLDLQNLLVRSGETLSADGDFGRKTEAAVRRFQIKHVGPDRQVLEQNGVVGSMTWWALLHQTAEDQGRGDEHAPVVSGEERDSRIPRGLSRARRFVLQVALHELDIGIREIPDGSNWSTKPEGGIAKYDVKDRPKKEWCLRFCHWCLEQAVQAGLIDPHLKDLMGRSGSASGTSSRAEEVTDYTPSLMLWYDNDGSYVPRPGDVAILDRHGCLVLRVSLRDGKLSELVTVDGNSANRVRLNRRRGSTVVGFVNVYRDGDEPSTFEVGLIAAGSGEGVSTR